MKRSLVKLVGLTYLFAATHFMTIGCSSSEEGTGEEVVAEEGNEAANAEGNNAENDEGNNNNNANNEEGGENNGNNLANNEGNAAGGNEFGNGAEGGNANANANANGGAEGGNAAPASDDNLSQIIEEMNQTNPAAAAAPEGGFDNLAQNAGNGAAPAGAPAPAAEASASAPAPAASGAPVAPGLPELGSKMAYIVQKGDTLGKIAQRVYGDTNKWTEIADFTGIANPKLIYPGDIVYYQLTEKTTAFASAYEGIGRSEVQVSQGDTLATIAQKVFGNSSLWKLIWRQNDKIDNPDKLTAGTMVYYVDHSKMAAISSDSSSKIVELKSDKVDENKGKNAAPKKVVRSEKNTSQSTSKVEVKSSKTIEVANDQVIDQFSHINSQNLVARLI